MVLDEITFEMLLLAFFVISVLWVASHVVAAKREKRNKRQRLITFTPKKHRPMRTGGEKVQIRAGFAPGKLSPGWPARVPCSR